MSATSQLTYSTLWLAVFARQLCLPVPALLFLITAGALAAHGQLHLSLVLLMGVLGCLAGDGVWFWLGRRWGSRVIRLVCSLTVDPRGAAEGAHRLFARWGLRGLIVSKFVPGMDAVTPPLAGAEGSTVRAFVAFDAVGSLLWTALYVVVGLLFSNQVERAVTVVEHFGSIVGLVVGVPLLLFVAWRLFQLVRMIRHLRLRRISPALLALKLEESDRVAVFDLLNFEGDEGSDVGIPGAVRIEPARLRAKPHPVVPGDIDVILYCASRNELTSARVAAVLQKHGIENVWVLEGGLTAWQQDGRAVTREMNTAEEVAARLGIELPPWPRR